MPYCIFDENNLIIWKTLEEKASSGKFSNTDLCKIADNLDAIGCLAFCCYQKRKGKPRCHFSKSDINVVIRHKYDKTGYLYLRFSAMTDENVFEFNDLEVILPMYKPVFHYKNPPVRTIKNPLKNPINNKCPASVIIKMALSYSNHSTAKALSPDAELYMSCNE
jgi:hypothetical protein